MLLGSTFKVPVENFIFFEIINALYKILKISEKLKKYWYVGPNAKFHFQMPPEKPGFSPGFLIHFCNFINIRLFFEAFFTQICSLKI